MEPCKSFTVFGEPVEILVDSSITNGAFAVLTQTSPPGGGPPPHRHTNEDEIFTTIDGEFEIFDGATWHPLPQGSTARGVRGRVHGFRNCGTTVGKMQVIVYPAGFEKYLEEISPLAMPQDLEQLLEVSERYGVTFSPPATDA